MQGQMDHGLANARFNEQQENIAPILDALRKYGSGVAGRVSAFADDPAQALYGGFADTMGLNLDRPIEEYAEMARNPQAGEIDPNSPAVLEAMGWLPGPMGALGTIAGKGGKNKLPWQMSRSEYDAPATLMQSDGYYIPIGNNQKVYVSQNPSLSELGKLNKEARKQYGLSPGEAVLRHTEDADGNKYYWNAYEAVHPEIEPKLTEKLGVNVDQNAAGKQSHRNVVRRALYEGQEVPKQVIDEYPGLLDEVSTIEGNKVNLPLIDALRNEEKLPMDEASRMQRAKDMGFDTDTTLYHGTASDVPSFDKEKMGSSTDAYSARQGVWVADDPGTARGYAEYAANDVPVKRILEKADDAEKAGNWDLYDKYLSDAEELEKYNYNVYGKGQNVMPLTIKGNIKQIDMDGAEFMDKQDEINKIIRTAKSNDYDGVRFNNLADDVGLNNRPTGHTIVFNPKNIRSKFAKFDPSKKESANLLAGLGGLGLGLNYLGSSEDAAETDKTIPLIDALRNKEFY